MGIKGIDEGRIISNFACGNESVDAYKELPITLFQVLE